MADLTFIQNLVTAKRLDYCHYTLARFIKESIPEASDECLWLCVLVNLEIDQGNVCLDLAALTEKSESLGWNKSLDQAAWQDRLASSAVVGNAQENKPLIVDQQRLYLNRYYHYEKTIADHLRQLSLQSQQLSSTTIQQIESLFGSQAQTDFQKVAAIISCRQALSIISGGPGTGKTWTVSHILTLLIEQQADIHIRLAAPTGKAATRLSESIRRFRESMPLSELQKQQIPEQAVTLHRLLGIHRFTHRPRHDAENPLDCDVLVLDEASMIDQQMMAMLCAALSPQARLILLGDKDQLSSVEAGSVFSDICGGLRQTAFSAQQCAWFKQQWDLDLPSYQGVCSLNDHVVVLEQSHRFDARSGIGQLAARINRGQSDDAIALLKAESRHDDIHWRALDDQDLSQALQAQAQRVYCRMPAATSIAEAFALFDQYQILCAIWSGPSGVDQVNEIIESEVKRRCAIAPETEFYSGKPLMMTQNVYQYDIYNGDIGILWPDEEDQLRLWFASDQGEYRALSLSQLPAATCAYAMTVHKSQGSEFNHVLFLLPAHETPVCTRELFYTAITRAAQSVEIWGSEASIASTIAQKTQRSSGLMQRLMDEAIKTEHSD